MTEFDSDHAHDMYAPATAPTTDHEKRIREALEADAYLTANVAKHDLRALQPQPAAAVSDEEINRIVWEHTRLNPNQAADSGLMLCIRNAVRAILALRPQAVPGAAHQPGESASYRDENDMPTEVAVLKREWLAMRKALSYRPAPPKDHT